MASGGSRNRSGPPPVEGSRTSDRKGYSLTALPTAGYDGEVPEFPLPDALAREVELWNYAWTSPMACAWSTEPWRWYTIGQWVRWSVKAEDAEASAAIVGAVIRLADQIGMTPAGRAENGWKIADASPPEPVAAPSNVTDIKNRLNRGSA